MSFVSYLRTPGRSGKAAPEDSAASRAARPPRRRRIYTALGVLAALVAAAVVAVFIVHSAKASLKPDATALARVHMPAGGGTIQSVSAVAGPKQQPLPVQLRGDLIYPRQLVPAHQTVTIDAVVKRPGWVSWLGGGTEHLRLTTMTPSASLRSHWLTLAPGAPITLQFVQPISEYSYGPSSNQLRRQVLSTPQSQITLARPEDAGVIWVAAAPQPWERSPAALVSYFPAGAGSMATVSPTPGTKITPYTPITLTFNHPVSQALGSHLPPVSPATPGGWQVINNHTIRFNPTGAGYGLGAQVSVALPGAVRLLDVHGASGLNWTVPNGSTLRVQQLLANLGYLPLTFHASGPQVALNARAEEDAAAIPPTGTWTWSYSNVPAQLMALWKPGASGVMTRGALMAFENDHNLTTDGVAGPAVWKALIAATIANQPSHFGYTFAMVSLGGQNLHVWHSGRVAITTPVNTGVAGDGTAAGIYPVFEHQPSVTMSGPGYSDPGVPWVSYFNGGDALHGFQRASYGFPQSLGCVEMPIPTAARVYPYTPIGTLVDVS